MRIVNARWGGELISFEFHRGDHITHPGGENPLGYLMYTSNGYMLAHVMAEERSLFTVNDPRGGTFEESADAMNTYTGYCGTYTVRENVIIHHVEVSWYPNWTGTQIIRHFKREGDTLKISTPPMLVEGVEQTVQIVWRKIGPSPER